MNFPVIKVEFESMRQSLRVAMTDRMIQIDSDIQDAIDRFCTPEKLQNIIDEEVRSSVIAAVSEEVQSLFRHSGAGRKAIREEIKKYADEFWADRGDA